VCHVLYAVKNRAIENIPLTADALRQHCKRASLQTRIWKSCLHAIATTEPCNPCEWGLKFDEENGVYTPVWSTIPDVSSHCSELIRCTCKTVCRNCKCRKKNLPCTKLCACDGVCDARSPAEVGCSEHPVIVDKDDAVYDLFSDYDEEDTEADNVLDIVFDDT